jgi:hypothetical protein
MTASPADLIAKVGNVDEPTLPSLPPLPRGSIMFLYSGLLFLFVALGLFALGGFSLYKVSQLGTGITIFVEEPATKGVSGQLSDQSPMPANLTERDRYNYYGRIISVFLGPVLLFLSAFCCAYVGIRLLRSAGAVERSVIPSQDYHVLAGAISAGNEKAISEYIRLSSLSGTTGMFTKIGLTGLPLATIFLTVLLCAVGIFVPKFLDLAQLTLGAFIGSYVQKKQTEEGQGA